MVGDGERERCREKEKTQMKKRRGRRRRRRRRKRKRRDFAAGGAVERDAANACWRWRLSCGKRENAK